MSTLKRRALYVYVVMLNSALWMTLAGAMVITIR